MEGEIRSGGTGGGFPPSNEGQELHLSRTLTETRKDEEDKTE